MGAGTGDGVAALGETLGSALGKTLGETLGDPLEAEEEERRMSASSISASAMSCKRRSYLQIGSSHIINDMCNNCAL